MRVTLLALVTVAGAGGWSQGPPATVARRAGTGQASGAPQDSRVTDGVRGLMAATHDVEQLTQQRFDANAANDRAFYERLLAPTFMMLTPHEFPPASRQQYLDAEFPPGRARRPRGTISGLQVASDGNVATASYEVVEPYPLGEAQHFELRSRRLDTYARIDGQWRLLSMAVAEPPTWPAEVTLPPALLASYAGLYRMTSTQSVTITVENGRLMAEVTGQPRVPLFAENESTFFDRTDSPLARTVFERDERGQVVAQVYRALGQELRASKVR